MKRPNESELAELIELAHDEPELAQLLCLEVAVRLIHPAPLPEILRLFISEAFAKAANGESLDALIGLKAAKGRRRNSLQQRLRGALLFDAIWRLLLAGHERNEVVGMVADGFGVDESTVRRSFRRTARDPKSARALLRLLRGEKAR